MGEAKRRKQLDPNFGKYKRKLKNQIDIQAIREEQKKQMAIEKKRKRDEDRIKCWEINHKDYVDGCLEEIANLTKDELLSSENWLLGFSNDTDDDDDFDVFNNDALCIGKLEKLLEKTNQISRLEEALTAGFLLFNIVYDELGLPKSYGYVEYYRDIPRWLELRIADMPSMKV